MAPRPLPARAWTNATRAAPAAIACLVALLPTIWWSEDEGGFAIERWVPGALLVVGLLVVAVLTAPNRWREVPRSTLAAVGLLAAYTAWSYASIAWAGDPGFALEGAARTSSYLAVFALFSLWATTGRVASALVALWIAVVTVAGIVLAFRLAGATEPLELFNFGRLKEPTGYPNATAALLMMPVLPAVVLSAGRDVPWWVRGACAGSAVLLASLTVLTVSRGAVYFTPVAVIVLLAVVPGRIRNLLALVPVTIAVGICTPGLLDVGNVFAAVQDARPTIDSALQRVALASVTVAVLTAVVAWAAARRPPAPATARRLELGSRLVAGAIVVAVLGGGLVVAGNPVDRVDSAWASFKGGYSDNNQDGNRLVGGLGSSRYDVYRVALEAARDHPVAGLGADNFYQRYLRDGSSEETPRYPHSVELRTLSQTGVVGSVLLLAFLVAAAVAALRGMRSDGARSAAAGGAAVMTFTYWVLHGSFDWFWEWGGLGMPAFAFLGLACALAPRREMPEPSENRSWRRPAGGVAAVAGGLVLAVPLVAIFAADREQRLASAVFASAPQTAYDRLDRAASLNPLSSAPKTLEGTIALRFGDLPRADIAFASALERVPDDQYATLERGAVASAQGRPADALRLLRRAVELAPRDELTRSALRVVNRGQVVNVRELNRRILAAAGELTSG